MATAVQCMCIAQKVAIPKSSLFWEILDGEEWDGVFA